MTSQVVGRLAALVVATEVGLHYYSNHAENRGDLGVQEKTNVIVGGVLNQLSSNTAVFKLTRDDKGRPHYRIIGRDSEEVLGFIREGNFVSCLNIRFNHNDLRGKEINIEAAVVGKCLSRNSCSELQEFQDALYKQAVPVRD